MEQKYKQAFSKLKASPEKIQEVITMTETRKPRKIVRNLLVTAAIMALAVLTAMGANAASGGELFTYVVSYVFDGENVEQVTYKMDDGSVIDGSAGTFEITEDENGKAILTYTDENGEKVSKSVDAFQFNGEADAVAAG